MRITFRWFGPSDPVRLDAIRQVPGVRGIVSALHEIPPGVVWPRGDIERLRDEVESAGLELDVIESVPVHEDIKLGRPARDALIDEYARTLRNIGEAGIRIVCYNFMPVFDWMRTDLAMRLEDGSTALAYDDAALAQYDVSRPLPGWAAVDARDIEARVNAYRDVDADQLWDNLAYFLERVVPAAEAAGVSMAIHPDDPPWPILGLPRIITDVNALERLLRIVDSPSNGITFCTGSLGALPSNDLPSMIRELGRAGRIHFVHCRNVRVTGERQFHETQHPSSYGDVDMLAVMRALNDVGFSGPIRPDHGRMIWGEQGRPGYGLYDRALGAAYVYGLQEAVSGASQQSSSRDRADH